ncbi:Uncharacterized protein FWK35_00033009, partial [Aphis craccivora]
FYTSHPSIHEVINILLDIQSETYLKINSIKTNNKNKPRKEQIDKLTFITETWTKLEKNEISAEIFESKKGETGAIVLIGRAQSYCVFLKEK